MLGGVAIGVRPVGAATSSAQSIATTRAKNIAEFGVARQLAMLGVDHPTQEQIDKAVQLANDPAFQTRVLAELEAAQQLAKIGLEEPTQAQVNKAVELKNDPAFQEKSQAEISAWKQLLSLGNPAPSVEQVQKAVEHMRDPNFQDTVTKVLNMQKQKEIVGVVDPNSGTLDALDGLTDFVKPDGGTPFNPLQALLDALSKLGDGKRYTTQGSMIDAVKATPGNTAWNPLAPDAPTASPSGQPAPAAPAGSPTSSSPSSPSSPSSSSPSEPSSQSEEPAERPARETTTRPASEDHGSREATGRDWTQVRDDDNAWTGNSGQSTTRTEAKTVEYKNSDGTYTYETTTRVTHTDENGKSTTTETKSSETTEKPKDKGDTTDEFIEVTGPMPPADEFATGEMATNDGSHAMMVYSGKFGSFWGTTEHLRSGNPGTVWGDYGDSADANAAEIPTTGVIGPPTNDPWIHVDPDAGGDTTMSPEQIEFTNWMFGDYANPNDPNYNSNTVDGAQNPHDQSPYEHDTGDGV
jgi:hypothetical protein